MPVVRVGNSSRRRLKVGSDIMEVLLLGARTSCPQASRRLVSFSSFALTADRMSALPVPTRESARRSARCPADLLLILLVSPAPRHQSAGQSLLRELLLESQWQQTLSSSSAHQRHGSCRCRLCWAAP